MRKSLVLVATATTVALAAMAACSSGSDSNGGTIPDASTGNPDVLTTPNTVIDSGEGENGDAGGADADDGATDAGTGNETSTSTLALVRCNVPSPPPSGGSCVTIGEDAGNGNDEPNVVDCNPIANNTCDAGTTCEPVVELGAMGADWIGVGCSAAIGTAVCGTTDCHAWNRDTTTPAQWCAPGLTCIQNGGDDSTCAALCCSDADCGSGGHCVALGITLVPGVGVCATTADAGADWIQVNPIR